ncbi:MAG TPA: VOC family protein [Caulobacterales bacterium]|nr:VOC family protein [Caulobacterales bacterium]
MIPRGAVHHIDLSVSDLAAARAFYEPVLGFMGYGVGEDYGARGVDFDHVEPGRFWSIGIRISEGPNAGRAHDRYAPGLHHLAWAAASREDVDALHALLLRIGARVLDAPADYPQYGAGYYAVFFADPDGLKLEYVFKP